MSGLKTNVSKVQTRRLNCVIVLRLTIQNYTFRLKAGQHLFDSAKVFFRGKNVEVGCVLSGVGNLRQATLRLANRDFYLEYDGRFEIVSITGTVSVQRGTGLFPPGIYHSCQAGRHGVKTCSCT
jgi:hypothetical protein